MFARFGAQLAAVHSARRQRSRFHFKILAASAAMTASLGGCMPATVPLVGADPAEPSVKVARVGYGSTIAPYTPMRPSTPAGWGDSGTAPSRPDR
jgi:hypothetical protein